MRVEDDQNGLDCQPFSDVTAKTSHDNHADFDAIDPPIDDFLGPDGPLAASRRFAPRTSPPFAPRLSQQTYAKFVARSVADGLRTAVEGPTGTGKSLGYLVGWWFARNASIERRPLIVATATNALADQLLEHDLPTFARALERARSAPCTVATIRGRRNYVCNANAVDLGGSATQGTFAGMRMLPVLPPDVVRWLDETESGERSDVPFAIDPALWARLSIDAEDCLNDRCDERDRCFYRRAREQVRAADVIVTNHHVLILDAYLAQIGVPTVLPLDADLVIDEAHLLSENAIRCFAFRFSPSRLDSLARFFHTEQSSIDTALGLIDDGTATWAALRPWRPRWISRMQELSELFSIQSRQLLSACQQHVSDRHRTEPIALNHTAQSPIATLDDACVDALGVLERLLEPFFVYARIQTGQLLTDVGDVRSTLPVGARKAFWKLARAQRRIARIHDVCDEMLGAEPDAPLALWYEYEPSEPTRVLTPPSDEETKDRYTIQRAYLSRDEFLREALYPRYHSVTLTSATLTIAQTFDFLASQTGCSFDATCTVESPFDYAHRCLTVVPSIVEPTHPDWRTACTRVIERVIDVCDGRTLALFSSAAHRDACYEALVDGSRSWLLQGHNPPKRLIRQFREDERSVLFATRSFWTGVDVPGVSCVAVVIDRLPFVNQNDPIVLRRRELDDRAFEKFELPEMLMLLRQGFGRLLRGPADFGVVVLLDVRAVKSRYASRIWSTLPRTRQGRTSAQIAAFLAEFGLSASPISAEAIR